MPSTYEKLDNLLEGDNDLQETNELKTEPYRQPRMPPRNPKSSELFREKVPQQSLSKPNPSTMTSPQLKGYLSQFYLIRTPYGYILGRHSPARPLIATTSLTRRSVQAPKSEIKEKSHGEFLLFVSICCCPFLCSL